MGRSEARVRKLETAPGNGVKVFVWIEPGESEADAIRRRGYDPDDSTLDCILVRWASEADKNL